MQYYKQGGNELWENSGKAVVNIIAAYAVQSNFPMVK